jgi:hypothetical protein
MSKKATLSSMHKQLDSAKEKPKKEPKKKELSSEPMEHIPRGERSAFLKISITIPGDLLMQLRTLGTSRKAAGKKDTDTSALIREAVIDFLNKNKEE